jgi:hypothetical protein
MLTRPRRPVVKLMPDLAPPASAPAVVPGPHRQRFTIEVLIYRTPAEIDHCVATPVAGRRVVLYGGDGPLPPALVGLPDRVVRLTGADPLKASVLAHAGLRDGDTLTLLLPHDWSGPPVGVLLDHARRWFGSPHSSEDDVHFG